MCISREREKGKKKTRRFLEVSKKPFLSPGKTRGRPETEGEVGSRTERERELLTEGATDRQTDRAR